MPQKSRGSEDHSLNTQECLIKGNYKGMGAVRAARVPPLRRKSAAAKSRATQERHFLPRVQHRVSLYIFQTNHIVEVVQKE